MPSRTASSIPFPPTVVSSAPGPKCDSDDLFRMGLADLAFEWVCCVSRFSADIAVWWAQGSAVDMRGTGKLGAGAFFKMDACDG